MNVYWCVTSKIFWFWFWTEEVKNRFSRRWPSRISDQNDFSYFWSTSHRKLILPTKFHINWPLGSEKQRKIDFQDGGHLGFPIGTILLFLIYKLPWCFQLRFKTLAFWFRRREKVDFQDGGNSSHLGFPMGRILLFLIYKSPWCFLLCFKTLAFWFRSRREQIDFQDGCNGSHLGISDLYDFSFSLIYKPTLCFLSFQVNWPFGSGEEGKNRLSWLQPQGPSHRFLIRMIFKK